MANALKMNRKRRNLAASQVALLVRVRDSTWPAGSSNSVGENLRWGRRGGNSRRGRGIKRSSNVARRRGERLPRCTRGQVARSTNPPVAVAPVLRSSESHTSAPESHGSMPDGPSRHADVAPTSSVSWRRSQEFARGAPKVLTVPGTAMTSSGAAKMCCLRSCNFCDYKEAPVQARFNKTS